MSSQAGKKGTVIDHIWRDGKWFYVIRWEDGTETVEPEWRIEEVH